MKKLLLIAAVVGGFMFATAGSAEAGHRHGFRRQHFHGGHVHMHHGVRPFYGYNNFGYQPGFYFSSPRFSFGVSRSFGYGYGGYGGGYGGLGDYGYGGYDGCYGW
jgi:hypothetical protein